MDKSWINNDARHTKAYLQGVNSFLAFAFRNSAVGNKILCPCRKCVNSFWREASDVREHLICDGFLNGYTRWNLHGEPTSSMYHMDFDGAEEEESSEDDDISGLLRDLAAGLDDRGDFDDNSSELEPCAELLAIQKLVAENSKELYPNCKKYTQLRFLVRLLHLKLLGGWTDRSFNLLLDLLNDALPEGSALSRNFHEAKKLVKSIGIGYTSIHACENDCILYWKGNSDLNVCPKCKVSRWKSIRKSLDGKHIYKVPRKVLRYFPIKKCLQRLFLSSKTASLTRWHDEGRKKDGLLRHPADSPLWQDFNEKNQEFAADSRNIRLAFATDGFNPYRSMNVNYSIWPGICIPYNFPPSMCMKQSNFILSLLIPGRHGPGSDMDVYYQPLVEDLLDMFENGVRTYDASKSEYFQLRAVVLWTITDFPGLGYASGSVTAGGAACPDCHSHTCSIQCEARTESCKLSHGKLKLHHTAGSKSFACTGHELGVKLGRPARRDELFIKTHTRKNGVPSRQAEHIIKKLEEIVEARPELKERTIQEGDAFAAACGEKEPRGRVRVMGLGPTPQDVRTPGLRCYTPTRLQMEVLARKKVESEKAALEWRMAEMEAELQQERMARNNVDINSHNGSNSRLQTQSPRSEEHGYESNRDAECEDDDADNYDHFDEDQFLLVNRRVAAPSSQPLPYQSHQRSSSSAPPPKNNALRSQHEELVGKDVILYAMLRSDLPVAKGTIISTNPSTMVGGQALGKQFCEVIVNLVLKRDAILPRPYPEMNTMADAFMMSIAWPYRKLKVSRASKSPQAAAGNSGRSARQDS